MTPRQLASVIVAVGALSGCRERYLSTPKLEQAIAQEGAPAASAASKPKSTGVPAELAAALTGGEQVFTDDFSRTHPGAAWKLDTPEWRIEEGELTNRGADNAGAWLLTKLPEGDTRIEFDVRSMPYTKRDENGEKQEVFPGDIKCEAFNTAPSHQTGYIFIFGGWNNRVNRIARLEEHGNGPGAQVTDGPTRPVEAGHTYRIKVVRVGGTVGLYADDQYLVHYTDDEPITGRHFGFNNWRSELHFDNVAVYALAGAAKPSPTPPPTKGPTAPPT